MLDVWKLGCVKLVVGCLFATGAAAQTGHGTETGADVCGASATEIVWAASPQLKVPSYDNTDALAYFVDMDERINAFSPELGQWVVSQIQKSLDGFEANARIGEIHEQKTRWTLTVVSGHIANVEQSVTIKSVRFPDGATTRYTHLFNRDTGKKFEIEDLFLDRTSADKELRKMLLDRLVLMRAEFVEEYLRGADLLPDTDSRLPDEILDSLDIELSQNEADSAFDGLKIVISEDRPWNWFPEGGYEVVIGAPEFSHLLKPVCDGIFSEG